MKRALSFLSLLMVATLACSLTGTPTVSAQPVKTGASPTTQDEPDENPSVSAEQAVLLFTIGIHIEPQGTTAQGYESGNGDYHHFPFFQRHVQDIQTIADIVETHSGHMTIQAQSPFTSMAIETENTILTDLAAHGHEIALHFHEDAHLGKNSESCSVEEWCKAMNQEITLIAQASGITNIRYWSGGNLYVDLFKAATCAGLDINSDWKNPRIQETDLSLAGVNPWRPAGGTDGTNFALFSQHNPNGTVIFLPEGQYDKSNFASMRRSEEMGNDEAYFEYLKEMLYASLAETEPGKVGVFHFTVHPGEFRGNPNQPFAVIENFLAEVVDPLVANGQVRWATFSEMADAYIAWEAANPDSAPR